MFARIAGFELRYQLRNPVIWAAAIIFFLLAFGATTVDNIQIGSGGNVHKNAPFSIAQIELIFTLFYMFVSTAFVANVVVRDDDTGFGPIVRATRVTKVSYLLGRYCGAYLVAALGYLSIPLGIWIGTHMPWVDPETIGPNRLFFYLAPYLWLALPNLFFTSAILFAVATMTRSMMASYLAVLALIILYTVVTVVLRGDPARDLASGYLDPLGFGTFRFITRYWTASDRNGLILPVESMLLINRALALAIGCTALALAYSTFQFGTRSSRFAQRRSKPGPATIETAPEGALLAMPRFDGATTRAQLWLRTRFEIRQVFRSPAFLVLMGFGLFNSLAALFEMGELFGTPVWPVTRKVIELLNGSFTTIPIIIAIYYGGELVWRERDRKIHEIVDASAIPNWAYAVPKVLAVAAVLCSTLLLSVVGGIIVQLWHGYTDLEIGKYLLWYVLPNTLDAVLYVVLAVFLQTISPNKFVGWGLMMLFVIGQLTLGKIGLGDDLYNYAAHPALPLSDMNGLGRYWIGTYSFFVYWLAFALVLVVLTHVLWRRGTDVTLRQRLNRLPQRLRGRPGAVALAALLIFAATGVWCFTNTHVWNVYRTDLDEDRYAADYEKALLRYAALPQPAIAATRVTVALWPHQQRLVATGTMRLLNREEQPISEVHLRLMDMKTKLTAIDFPGATLVKDFPRFQYRIYRLASPLAPGASAMLSFRAERGQRGFRDHDDDTRLVDNGTFVNNRQIVPQLGMSRDGLLIDRAKRRKYGLTPELRPAKLEDLSATRANMLHADWTKADITIVTDADQTPIAPGDKVSDTIANGRRTARFVTTAPILNFYSIQSARYAERHLRHGAVDLAVYYDPRHGKNVDRMLAAFGHGLDLYEHAFGPYQFHQARIIEFPDYEKFAQAFAGTMPYSEGIGFIADLSNPNRIDYVTYVAAHELAHQWWAHQEVSADMQGATMLVESVAQYSALMTMEHLYGRDQIRRFLKYELDQYLRGRSHDVVEELPLDRVEDQQYIHYRKGSVVFYRLKDVLGEARVDAALRRFLDRFKFKSAPYPRSLDLIAELRKGASPQENALITDLLDRITLYDIRTKAAHVVREPNGTYRTMLTVEAHKYYADGKGKETEAALDEPIDYGLFSAMPGRGAFATRNVLAMQRLPVHSGIQTITLRSQTKPAFGGADPYNTLIDRNSDDNVLPTAP